jgi:hypothetical protein
MKLVNFPDFVDLHEVDRDEYQKLIAVFEPYSDFNYVSAFSWNEPGSCRVALLNDNLVLSLKDYLDDTQVLSFLGSHDLPDTARTLLQFAKNAEDYKDQLAYVPAEVARLLVDEPGLIIERDRDNDDYILSADEYMQLEGKKFENKRKSINRFKRTNNPDDVTLLTLDDPSVQLDVPALVAQWKDWGTQGAVDAENEAQAIAMLLKSSHTHGIDADLYCSWLTVDGKLTGFCIFEVIDNYAVTHFGKADLRLKGAYEYLMVETLRLIRTKFGITYVNNEQDLGIPGLRQSKLSQHPVKYLEKYQVSLA